METFLEKEERSTLVAALAEAVLASRIVRALMHRMLAKGVLDEDDARVIYDFVLSSLEEANAKAPHDLADDAWRLARKRAEQEHRSTADLLRRHRGGPEES